MTVAVEPLVPSQSPSRGTHWQRRGLGEGAWGSPGQLQALIPVTLENHLSSAVSKCSHCTNTQKLQWPAATPGVPPKLLTKTSPYSPLASADGKLCSHYNRGPISKAKVKAIKYSIVIILGPTFELINQDAEHSVGFVFELLLFNTLPRSRMERGTMTFICCWSPYFLFDILDNFNLLPDTQERFYASVIIQNLPALNSAINPLIYCVFSSSISFPCR
ncbi:Neuropeptide S receptor [Saguinus oedipus]|uniref:Neuropeptide S receptor n=1 Tax=Saguinus oedipus TaxID=9490 RepID=A0ABQ9UGC5_SAGOE|nr:Neuropeptide S receptor [Saguinus oedipus]